MIRGLIRKELWQHGWTLAFVALFLVSSCTLLHTTRFLREAHGSSLAALHFVVLGFAPLASLVLGHVLIATEFRHKTQLFLESLPLPRWRMIAVKYALGFGVLVAGVGLSALVGRVSGSAPEGFTPRMAAIVTLKAATFLWFAYSLFFAHAFLGRYRSPIAMAVVMLLVILGQQNVAIGDFPPLALVDNRFSYERHVFPTSDLAITAALAAALTVAGLLLGTIRDATVAAMLSERMSSREKAVVTLLVFGCIIGAMSVSDARKHRAPVRLPGAYDVQQGLAAVSASAAVDAPLPGENAALRQVAAEAADELDRLATFLHAEHLPQVFIVHRRDFRGNQFEKGDLKPRQGLMVRTNLTSPDFKKAELLQWIVRETLLVKSGGRLALERHAWVLDGFPQWWAHHAAGDAGSPGEWPEFATAKTALPADFSHASLRRWMSVRQELDESGSRALAACGLGVLAEKHGADACARFLSSMLSPDLPEDVRGWFYDATHPLGMRLKRAAGVPLPAFAAEWRAALHSPSP